MSDDDGSGMSKARRMVGVTAVWDPLARMARRAWLAERITRWKQKRDRRANAELIAALAELPDMWQRSAADARLAVKAHLDSLDT